MSDQQPPAEGERISESEVTAEDRLDEGAVQEEEESRLADGEE